MPDTPNTVPVTVPEWLLSHHEPGMVFSVTLPGQDKACTITLHDAWPVHWWSDMGHVLQVLNELLQPQNIPDPLDFAHATEVMGNVDVSVQRWVRQHPVAYLLYATRCRTCDGHGRYGGMNRTCGRCLGVGIDPDFDGKLNPADVLKWGAYTAP